MSSSSSHPLSNAVAQAAHGAHWKEAWPQSQPKISKADHRGSVKCDTRGPPVTPGPSLIARGASGLAKSKAIAECHSDYPSPLTAVACCRAGTRPTSVRQIPGKRENTNEFRMVPLDERKVSAPDAHPSTDLSRYELP